jgi:hypothetical protein
MHALVASVLLRMARLDALDLNAEPEPPHRKLRKVEQGIRADKGNGSVGADGIRQSALSKEPLERRERQWVGCLFVAVPWTPHLSAETCRQFIPVRGEYRGYFNSSRAP